LVSSSSFFALVVLPMLTSPAIPIFHVLAADGDPTVRSSNVLEMERMSLWLAAVLLQRTDAHWVQVCGLLQRDVVRSNSGGHGFLLSALRRSGKPVVLAANKCEGRAGQGGIAEGYALGFGEAIALSAEHALGLGELQEALEAFDTTAKPAEVDTQEDGGDIEEVAAANAVATGICGYRTLSRSCLGGHHTPL